MNYKKYSLIIVLLLFIVVFVFMQKKSFDPRIGFDKPKGYLDYFKQITVPIGQKSSAYTPNYALFEYNKAVVNSTKGLKSAVDYSWVQRGPGNVGGRTRTVVVDPDDASGETWFAGSVSGGIWKTTNTGESWKNLTPNLPNLSIASMAISLSNTNVLYAGTGEGYGGEGMVNGNGIYKSIDKGLSWFAIESIKNDEHFSFVNKLWLSPSNENIVIAATNKGIFKTNDGGITWDSVYTRGYVVQDIAQNPLNENVLYAGVNSLGVIKSYDRGDTWVNCYNGMAELYRVSLSVSPVDTSYIFAGVEAPANQTHIYHSRDGGENWQLNYNTDGLFTDFHKSQGWFNNVVVAHPFDKSKVFVGGVYIGLLDFGAGSFSSTRDVIRVDTLGTAKYIEFVNFGGSSFRGALSTGVDEGVYDSQDSKAMEDFISIEIRFDTNLMQKAHRFTVPDGEGGGVPADQYSYEDYVDVPFQVWDIENNRQLMVSFRDQDKNGEFNLVEREYDNDIIGREYIFVNAVDYNAETPNQDITQAGGYEYKMLYFLWPTLPKDKIWDTELLSKAKLSISFGSIQFRDAYTTILADDKLNKDLHVDHHDMKFFIPESSVDSFIIIEANDGGLGYSTNNGVNWKQINKGYLTTQFYGVAKRASKHEYIGGMQDNGTWQSPLNQTAIETSEYEFRVEGDGFEALWHPWYSQRILASSYNNFIKISNDFGETWQWVDNRILGDGPFITKLSNSRENPDLVFAVGSKGVFKHSNFGFGTASWENVDLGESWAINEIVTSSHNVKVSKANPSVVWAGGAMYSKPDLNIFISKDFGKTFDTVSNYLEEELGYIAGMATHPTNSAEAFLLFSFKGKPKIIRTYDYGQSWGDISGFAGHDGDSSLNNFPDVVVHDLLVMPNDTNTIWVATEIGLFESLDNGISWNYSNCGLPAVSIWQLDIIDGHVIVATHGRGLWTADLGFSIIDKVEVKNEFEVSIYPNPASDYIQVSINSQETVQGEIQIIDIMGRKVISQNISSLANSTRIDISMLLPGNYIVFCNSEGNKFIEKLIVRD